MVCSATWKSLRVEEMLDEVTALLAEWLYPFKEELSDSFRNWLWVADID